VIEATKSSNIASTVFGILSDEEKLKDMWGKGREHVL
jgi:hypothetical protein